MKHLSAAVALFLGLLLPATLFANPAIDTAYKQIHTEACSGLGANPCPSLNDSNERFAFVVTWCEHNPNAAACTSIKNVKGGPAVIAFNHDTQAWRAIYGVTDDQIQFDKDGVPKVLTSSGRVVIPVVESTNPLLYQAAAGAVTETDPAVIANLQKIFDKIGPELGTLVGLAAQVFPPSEQANLDPARKALARLDCAVKHWNEAAQFAERVEKHRNGEYRLIASECGITADTADQTFAALDTFLKSDPCATEATQLRDALNMTGNPDEMLNKANGIVIRPQCGAEFIALRARTVQLAKDLKAAAGDPVKVNKLKTLAQGDIDDIKATTDLIDAVTQADSADNRKKIEEILGKIADFEDKVLFALATEKPKTAVSPIDVKEVADFFIVPKGSIIVSADKDRSRTLTVTKASPFDKPIAKRPDSVSSSYAAESLYLSLIDITAAMTFTGLTVPEFGTVTQPAPTTDHPDATKQVIAKKDEKRRSGKVAAFVEFPIFANSGVPVRRVVGAVGVGTDSDITALFAGLSYRATTALHIGGGITWQSVKVLDGQKVGDTVAAATDIKLKDKRDHSWYVSFSFSLGSLSLFKGL